MRLFVMNSTLSPRINSIKCHSRLWKFMELLASLTAFTKRAETLRHSDKFVNQVNCASVGWKTYDSFVDPILTPSKQVSCTFVSLNFLPRWWNYHLNYSAGAFCFLNGTFVSIFASKMWIPNATIKCRVQHISLLIVWGSRCHPTSRNTLCFVARECSGVSRNICGLYGNFCPICELKWMLSAEAPHH